MRSIFVLVFALVVASLASGCMSYGYRRASYGTRAGYVTTTTTVSGPSYGYRQPRYRSGGTVYVAPPRRDTVVVTPPSRGRVYVAPRSGVVVTRPY